MNILKISLLSFFMVCLGQMLMAQTIQISGFVKEKDSGELLKGVRIWVGDVQTSSNDYGFYSLKIPSQASTQISFSSVGYQPENKAIVATQNLRLDIWLMPATEVLDQVTVRATRQAEPTQMSKIGLSLQMVKDLPTLLGEKDIIKAIQLLPGIQRGTEDSTALFVRGGGADQNLILLDEAQVYNANHLFGFFSVFNGDALKSVDFYKGSFPARYGGRLSSVIDIKMKEGNQQKLAGEAGIGLLSSRFTLEGPIQKGKSSFLISARRSYFDIPFAIAAKANPSDKSNFYFYDLNAKVNFDLGTKDKLMLSSYFGADNLSSQTQAVRTAYTVNTTDRLSWGNATATARWNHLFSEKLFANTTLLFTNFEFNFSNQFKQTFVNNTPTIDLLSKFSSGIQDFSLKFDMDYFPNNQHNLKWGGILTHHKFSPRTVTSTDPKTQVAEVLGQDFRNQELAVYVEDHYEIKKGLSVNAGLRASAFLTNGKNYLRAEPRISLGYQLPKDWMLKASYTRNNQFIHLLSNTGIGLSTDLWVPTTAVLAPQQSDQWAIGLSKNFDKQGLSFSVESYRKYMRNIVAYKEGADFLSFAEGVVNTNWENKVTTGKGWAYGTEFLLQKEQGRLRGWVGYTLSWVVHQFDDLNQGKRFFPKNDRRHDATIALSYQLRPKIKLTANWSYATGNALTVTEGFVPQGTSYGNGDGGGVLQPYQRSNFYNNRGNFRAEAFHRLDVGIQFHKPKPWGERYWEIGIYNLYNRSNPFYYYPSGNYNSNEIQIKKRGMFPIVPSVSYHIKF